MGALSAWLSGKKTYLAVTGLVFIALGAFLQKADFTSTAIWDLGKQILQDIIPAFIRLGISKNK